MILEYCFLSAHPYSCISVTVMMYLWRYFGNLKIFMMILVLPYEAESCWFHGFLVIYGVICIFVLPFYRKGVKLLIF